MKNSKISELSELEIKELEEKIKVQKKLLKEKKTFDREKKKIIKRIMKLVSLFKKLSIEINSYQTVVYNRICKTLSKIDENVFDSDSSHVKSELSSVENQLCNFLSKIEIELEIELEVFFDFEYDINYDKGTQTNQEFEILLGENFEEFLGKENSEKFYMYSPYTEYRFGHSIRILFETWQLRRKSKGDNK